MTDSTSGTGLSPRDRLLFLGCFVALITTAFGFILRTMLINEWGVEFSLTETQKGEIFGVGLWPFAISIVVFSLIIDRIGYGCAMVFAFACHVISAVMTIFAEGYWSLWIATFIVALGNGTVEAVINPVVATLFRRDKTKWLNILHAGWPGGLVLGGMLALLLGDLDWRIKVLLLLVPAVLYAAMLLRCVFPLQERVAAGVSYKDMLREAGALGMFIVVFMIAMELGRVAGLEGTGRLIAGGGVALAVAGSFGAYVRSLGRPLFLFLLLVMIPLAITELGTDSWITPIMEGEMAAIGLDPVWVLVYTAAIMTILRLYAGPIVHRLSPLGLLATSSLIAALGLVFLSRATGMTIFLAATIYGLGKTFFWPTMLGVVAERFPKGGALTLNATGGMGMLSVGVIGTVFLGFWADTGTTERLLASNEEIYSPVILEKESVLGTYQAVDPDAVTELTPLLAEAEAIKTSTEGDEASRDAAYAALVAGDDYQEQQDFKNQIDGSTAAAQKDALFTVAIFPIFMLVCYLGLALYFKSTGGYRAEILGDDSAEPPADGGIGPDEP